MLNRWFSLNITMEKWPIIDKDFLFSENTHMYLLLCLSKRLLKAQNEWEVKSSPVYGPCPAISPSLVQTEDALIHCPWHRQSNNPVCVTPPAQTENLVSVHSAPSTDRAVTQHVPYPSPGQASGATCCTEPQVTGPRCKCIARET